MSESVVYEVQDRIAVITLNRPVALNALNREMIENLRKAIIGFDQDDRAWVAIITGAGRAFCAGRDLKERANDNLSGRHATAEETMYGDGLSMWPTPSKPMIAAVNGYALAGGFAVTQVCDIRIASESAMLGITEARVGLMAPFAIHLNKIISETAVMELVLSAEPIPAWRLLQMGFLNKVVPPERLMDEAIEMARKIIKNSPRSLRTFKQLVKKDHGSSEGETAFNTARAYNELLKSYDAEEGPKAFAEKRGPIWEDNLNKTTDLSQMG